MHDNVGVYVFIYLTVLTLVLILFIVITPRGQDVSPSAEWGFPKQGVHLKLLVVPKLVQTATEVR